MDHALRVLEFDRVLQQVAAQCQMPLARQRALDTLPTFDPEAVKAQLDQTLAGLKLLDQDAAPSLHELPDLRQEAKKSARGGVLTSLQLAQMARVLSAMRLMRRYAESADALAHWVTELTEDTKLETRLQESLDPDGEILDTASPELARLRQSKRNIAQRLQERIHSYTTGASRDLLSDPIVTTRSGRYVVPVKSEHRGKIRGIVHDTSSTGATLFVEPEDVVQLGNSLRETESAEAAEIERILTKLSGLVGVHGDAIAAGIEALGWLDLTFAKGRHAQETRACEPRIRGEARIVIHQGRHPLLDPAQAVPLSIDLGSQHDGLLITGPNTGGKTVAIKTVGLYVAMIQSGILPPALEVEMGPFSQIWADIGDEQSLQQSLSTFSGHIRNIATAVKELQPGALVLLDEVGAGTDPAEGAALARAILLTIQARKAKVMASTHYGELKVFGTNTTGFINASMEFDRRELRPTYRLLMGSPGASHALMIAERTGMPKEVIELAQKEAGVQQQEVSQMLDKLDQAEKRARKAQSESDRLAAKLREVERESERKLREIEEARREVRRKAAEQLEETLRELRLEAEQIFDQIKANPTQKGIELARSRFKDLQQIGQQTARDLRPAPRANPKTESAPLHKGAKVKVVGFGQVGTVVEEPRDGQAYVQLGSVKMRFPIAQLQPTEEAIAAPKPQSRPNLQLQKVQSTSMELVLISMRAEDAQVELDKFLDESLLAGFPSVRIVHGKGEGILRKLTHDRLRAHRGVASYRDGEPSEGGSGVTIAVLQ